MSVKSFLCVCFIVTSRVCVLLSLITSLHIAKSENSLFALQFLSYYISLSLVTLHLSHPAPFDYKFQMHRGSC